MRAVKERKQMALPDNYLAASTSQYSKSFNTGNLNECFKKDQERKALKFSEGATKYKSNILNNKAREKNKR